MVNWLSGWWVVVVAATMAAALFGMRRLPASLRRAGREPARRGAAAWTRLPLDHADFSEETLPAVLTRAPQWDER